MKFFPLKHFSRGFTLVELLVVISIISLLSSLVFSGLNNAKIRARDAERQSDMNQIYKALNLYFDTYGCLPTTSGSTCGTASGGAYSQSENGGWDYSSQGSGFLTFLQTAGLFTTVPVDPINSVTGVYQPGQYAYRYYCYVTGQFAVGLHLGYWSERTGNYVIKTAIPNANWADDAFLCR